MTDSTPSSSSPRWGLAAKLIFGLSCVAILGWFIIKFRSLLGPLILVFLVTYIIYPVARRITKWTGIPWRLVVTIIYLLLIILIIGILTLGGLALVDQLQNLVVFLQNALDSLPTFISNLSKTVLYIGPFQFPLNQVNVSSITSNILSQVQPLLSKVGSLLGIVATGAASTVGWIFFIIIISYFIIVESSGFSSDMINFHLPGYDVDVQKLIYEIKHIWNSFIRGQLTITSIVFVIYTIMLGIYGMPFFLGLALIAGLAKFIPYIGPFCVWTTLAIVAFLKGSYPFGLPPWGFAILVVGTAMLVDSITDNFISPRIMGQTLRVHPAAVLISALIAIEIIGLVGVVVAAPILATLQLIFGYAFRKMLDQDPWEGIELRSAQMASPFYTRLLQIGKYLFRKVRRWWLEAVNWLNGKFHKIHPDKIGSNEIKE